MHYSSYPGSIERLTRILNELRTKCPWDMKQTFSSLRPQTIEEVYELSDAILTEDPDMIKEELGDLLLHILFYSRLGDEIKAFDIHDVIETVCNKLVKRHPHIYEHIQVSDADEVKRNWEQNKIKAGRTSLFSGVPKSAPSMTKANIIQSKARSVGFDWENVQQVLDKLKEEIVELESAISNRDDLNIKEEVGDVIFSVINVARFLNIDADESLQGSNQKFIQRFQLMEQMILKDNKDISKINLDEMDIYWNEAKRALSI